MAISASAGINDLGSEANTDEVAASADPNLRLIGFIICEDAAGAAKVIIHHGTGNGDPAIAPIRLAANETVIVWLPKDGLECPNGLWVERVTGTTHVVIYSRIAKTEVFSIRNAR